jgi:hypothetical protein
LGARYAKVKNPSLQLSFTKDGETRVLTRQELSAAEAEYGKKLLALKKLYIEGTKHSKAEILPSSFKAAYTPVKIGPVFESFLAVNSKKQAPNFGLIPNEDKTGFIPKTNLLDALPRAKEGYILKNSLTLLMYIYCTVNNLKSKVPSEGQKNLPDERMDFVFGSLHSLYYQQAGKEKILMSKSGQKLSTYAVVSGKNTKFNPEKIENYYFQAIQSLNIYEVADLTKKDSDNLLSPTLRAELLAEYSVIETANNLLKKPAAKKIKS